MIKCLLPVLLIFFTSVSVLSQQSNLIEIPPLDSIHNWLDTYNVPAVGIGTIENGVVNQITVFGELKQGKKAPFNTIFDVASLTKSVVTILTLKLVSQGDWDLDEPLAKYWIDPDVMDDVRHKKLTTRHVLTRQTGFLNWRWQEKTKKLTFNFDPGTKVQYSGEGFEYLKKAIENKFQTSLEELSRGWIFGPSGMEDSFLVWNEKVDSTRLAIGHDNTKRAYEYHKSLEANAADNLLTTVEDFSRFGAEVMQKSGIEEKVYIEMAKPQSNLKEKVDFGLGWVVFSDLPNEEYGLFNAGGDAGVNAIILLLPKSKRGLIVMTNGDQGRAIIMKVIKETMGAVGEEMLNRL